MKQIQNFFAKYRFPLVSLALCVLAYGVLIPWLGLYWDDWALTWFSHEYSPAFFLDFAPYRPVSGWLYSLSFSLLGESIFAWQVYALLWHWLSALLFWWLLRLVWPRAGRAVEVAALLFALYPGFSQQPISVTYSLYFLYYAVFLFSLVLMLLAQRAEKNKVWLTAAALICSALVMLSTEYFYGLELLRPVLLWMATPREDLRRRFWSSARTWSPYLLLVIGLFGWRVLAAGEPGALYQPTLIAKLFAEPLGTIANLLVTVAGDLAEAGLLAWRRLVDAWAQLKFPSMATLAYFFVALLGAAIAAFAFWPRGRENSPLPLSRGGARGGVPHNWPRQAAFLGLSALLVGGLSFWVAELPLRLSFPWDRFTLPMMFGVALLLAAGWQALRIPATGKVILVAALVGLSVGYHFFNANLYREEWERQRSFFQQLQWRAPGLRPDTALLTMELPLEHYTDNSLTAPLNWIFASGDTSLHLPYYLAYLDLREDAELFGAGSGVIRKSYRFSEFSGNSADVLLLFYAPPGCLRILDPVLDAYYPRLPQPLADSVARSNWARILPEADADGAIPYWDAAPDGSWCYYFEKAELARQTGDWEQVAQLGDIAFSLEDAPNHPAERVPFVLGYAMVGEWDKAIALTEEALEINPLMQPMLCAAWAQINDQVEETAQSLAAANSTNAVLDCP